LTQNVRPHKVPHLRAVTLSFKRVGYAPGDATAIGLSGSQSPWRKLSAMKMLNDLRNHYQEKAAKLKSDPTAQMSFQNAVQTISDQMQAVIDAEENEQLTTIYINQLQLVEKP